MAGLVIVSHSHRLAEGVKELASQVSRGLVPVATAGGLDEQTLGTDPARIARAIEAVASPGGVLVLMDLGSAVLSAEMALEMVAPEVRERVVLSQAPLAEGAVAAAALLAAGAGLEEAAAEARGALASKQAHLGEASPRGEGAPGVGQAGESRQGGLPGSGPGSRASATVRVLNPLGLHARPAARLVEEASRFSSRIVLHHASRGGQPANARSINALVLMDARGGDEIRIEAEGNDAAQAAETLRQLVASGFGETSGPLWHRQAAQGAAGLQPAQPGQPLAPGVTLAGIGASPGFALGPVRRIRRRRPRLARRRVGTPEAEMQLFDAAVADTMRELEQLRSAVAAIAGSGQAAIFVAHQAILSDPEVRESISRDVRDGGLTAASAWHETLTRLADRYLAASNPILRERAADVQDVRDRVLSILESSDEQHAGDGDDGAETAGELAAGLPTVLVADDLAPSQVARLERGHVLAICTAGGGPTSHAAVLARAFGIPAVVALGPAILSVAPGTTLAVDGEAGLVVVAPAAEERERLLQREQRRYALRQAEERARHAPAQTPDGRRVEVAANASSLEDARAAVAAGAQGIGLLRTEFLFLDRDAPPSEDEQHVAYRAIAEAVEPHPVVIRTLDVGGDKTVRYIPLDREANPFLGVRGLRVSLAHPGLFRAQLRAILRVARTHRVRVMFPMVATPGELDAAMGHVQEAREELRGRGDESAGAPLEIGIMVEVPSAAVLAERFVGTAAFLSIGTNDLTQYTLAADRTNPRVGQLADPLHPAVLRLIQGVIDAAHRGGRWAGVCGEMAGDPLAAPVLLGLGLDEWSAAPAAVPAVKAVIRAFTMERATELARRALVAPDAAEVRAMIRQELDSVGLR